MHTNTIVSILGLAASARAHIIMNTPKGWQVNNSPLELDGSDFPCKGVAYDSSVTATQMNKGEKQPMKFTGSAVHGGGSCQVSLTTDTEPTKDSVWKVIKSFEGGCPAQGIDQNYPENAGMELPDTYNFEIPADVPDGKYTLAWTWFNKVGNREMYMNCAPIEASGGGGDEAAFGALPDMFKANIFGESTCRTPDSVDLEFPNAGEYVERLGTSELTAMVATDCPSSGGSGGGSSGGGSGGDYSGGGSEETTPTESGSESSPSESGAAQPSAPAEGGVFAPIDGSTGSPTSSAGAPAETSAAASPVESSPTGEQGGDDGSYQPEEPAPSAPSTGGEAGNEDGSYREPLPSQEVPAKGNQEVPAQGNQEDGSGSGSESGASAGGHEAGAECQGNGSWNCIDGTSYQRCASGVWSVVMQLAQGTECTPGEGETIQMVRKRGLTRFGAKFLL